MLINQFDDEKSQLIGSLAAVSVLLKNNNSPTIDIKNFNKIIDERSKKIGKELFYIIGGSNRDVLDYLKKSEINLNKKYNSTSVKTNTALGTSSMFGSILSSYNDFFNNPFLFAENIIDEFRKTKEGKSAIINFALEQDLDLTSINDNVKQIALLMDDELSKTILKQMMEEILDHHTNNSSYQKMSSVDKKSILFAILNLRILDKNEIWQEVIIPSAQYYQKAVGLDDDYFAELNELSEKYISLRDKVFDIITE